MLEDWIDAAWTDGLGEAEPEAAIGAAGTLSLSQPDPERWTRVNFGAEIEDAVVLANPVSARGAHPFTVAIRDVDDTGFEIRIEEWAYLDGAHGVEEIAWLAVSEGRHHLADGRVIEAGVQTLAAPDGLRFAEMAFAAPLEAPAVFGQIQSETASPATARLDAVSADGFRASLQQEEAAEGAVAAAFGWVALSGGPVTVIEGVSDAPRPVALEGAPEVVIAGQQTTNGPDTATLALDAEAGTLAIAEERSADRETTHAPETVALAGFEPGPIYAGAPGPEAFTLESAPERWSDPDTWGGRVPGPGETVVIEAGRTILLDTDVSVGGIMVHGSLIVEDARDLGLEADWMMVMCGGEFVVGTEAAPHEHDFTLTLTGDPEDRTDWEAVHGEADCPVTGGTCGCAVRDMAEDQTAFLMAMGEGAAIEIYGADAAKTDWTRLSATAEAGTRAIRLEEAPGWEVGDRIVIASTDFDHEQAETATVTGVSADGHTVSLDRALEHMHFGRLQSYEGGRVLDTRAEVGLLSRNIVIRGDEDAHLDGFGGHTMVMDGAEMRVSGVEFAAMGQEGRLGRYPVHWHLIGDASGQWITDSAIHGSFNRAVTVHGTDNARVEDVVAYDVIGHAFFLEDGSETGNRFERNLGLVTRAAEPGAGVLPTDETHVATFWITNPANTFLDNVAAGSDHGGFWIAPGPGEAELPLGRFEGNVGHSNAFANLAIDGHGDPVTGAFVESEYRPAGDAVIRDFTSYKSADRAIWVRGEGMEFHDIASADNARATFFSYNQVMYDSLVVGRSGNIGTPETAEEIAQGRSLPEPYHGRYFRGHSIYDGPSGVVDTHFAGFTAEDAAFQSQGAAQKSPAHFTSALSFERVMPTGRVDFSPQVWAGHMWSSGILDVDGTLTGHEGARLMPILTDADGRESRHHIPEPAIRREGWGAWVLPGANIGLLRADTDVAPGEAPVAQWSRADGEGVRDGGTFDTYHQSAVVLNGTDAYRLAYPEMPGRVTLSLRFAEAADWVVVELPGVSSEAVVAGAIEVPDRAALADAPGTAVLREATTLVVKLVAGAEEADPRFRANTEIAAAAANRFVAGVEILTGVSNGRPLVADFEAPDPRLETRAHLAAVSGPTPAWADQPDSIVFWDVTENGDGRAGAGELAIAVGGADWSRHEAVEIRAATQALGGGQATGYHVWIEDAQEGLTHLGRHDGQSEVSLAGLDPSARDEVDRLIFRVPEAEVAPAGREGDGQRLLLSSVALVPGVEARPVHLPALVSAGDSFGIVSGAITGAQGPAGPFEIVSVAAPIGGTVRTGVPGQGDNVFFDTDPGFSGIASFTAVLRDGVGRETQTQVSFEVVA